MTIFTPSISRVRANKNRFGLNFGPAFIGLHTGKTSRYYRNPFGSRSGSFGFSFGRIEHEMMIEWPTLPARLQSLFARPLMD
jgi:hypothetical protein